MTIAKVTELAYVRMRVPDIEKAARFFLDFGLIESQRTACAVYFRGYGPEQHLIIVEQGDRSLAALGLAVGSRADLDRIAAHSGVEVTAREEPGTGYQVTFKDPDGNRLEIVHGIATLAPRELRRQAMNDSRDRLRRKGEPCRPPSGPSHVLRLGHVVITTPQPDPLAAWYRGIFGFLVSDELFAGSKDNIVLSFNRADRGDEYVDHHLFQTMKGPPRGVHHVSFEVMDLDDLHCGSAHLAQQNYRQMWGVGRHKQGSQIFDYWLDPFGMMYEHWTDTDLLNVRSPATLAPIEDAQGPWGPPMPQAFITQVG